jgi:hypothetical protein
MKEYKFHTFRDKIEINLANISSSPDDEFKLHKVYYDHHLFTCELDGHKHCCYAFEIQNIQTQKIIKCGSECVHHFKGKGVDLDLAEALVKRIMKATGEARVEIRAKLGEDAFNALPESEKAQYRPWQIPAIKEQMGNDILKKIPRAEKARMTAEAYLIIQAKDLLHDFSLNRAFIDEEQVKKIYEMGLAEKYEAALTRREKEKAYQDSLEYRKTIDSYLSSLLPTLADPDPIVTGQFAKEIIDRNYPINLNTLIATYLNRKNIIQVQYPNICNYKGTNPTVLTYFRNLIQRGYLSYNEKMDAERLIRLETSQSTPDAMINFVLSKEPNNSFVNSLSTQLANKGFLSEKQVDILVRIYNNMKKA